MACAIRLPVALMHTYATYDTIVELEEDCPVVLMHADLTFGTDGVVSFDFDVSPFYAKGTNRDQMDVFRVERFVYSIRKGEG